LTRHVCNPSAAPGYSRHTQRAEPGGADARGFGESQREGLSALSSLATTAALSVAPPGAMTARYFRRRVRVIGRVQRDLRGEHRRQRPEYGPVRPALGEPPAHDLGQDVPEDLAERGADVPAGVAREPGNSGQAGHGIQRHGRHRPAPAKRGPRDEHPERLAGDRNRRDERWIEIWASVPTKPAARRPGECLV
jgi:hypothetical protein